MTAQQTVLAFDSSAAHCAAVLLRGDRVLASRSEEMARGQAERLMPLIEGLLADGGIGFSDLTRIGVGVGPGNFTGIRISVSAARGLALALGVPAIGVNLFDVIHLGAPERLAAVAAPRGRGYLRDTPQSVPRAVDTLPDSALLPPDPAGIALGIARIAATRLPEGRPAPLYIKAADAAPSRDAPPVILT